MNWIDIGIVALILYQAAAGFRHGIWRGTLDLTALVIALIVTITQFTFVAEMIRDLLSIPQIITLWISFLGCLAVSLTLLSGLAKLISRFIKRHRRTWPDRIGGFFLGSLRGALLVSFFLVLCTMMPIPRMLTSQLEQSPLAPSALSVVPTVYDTIAPRVLPGTRRFYDQLNRYFATPSAPTSNTARLMSPTQFLHFLTQL